MSPRIKFGLLAGAIGLALNTCVSGLFGICGPLVSLLAGGAAGFFAARGEKQPTQGGGAKVGAIAGAVSGALVLVGQIIGGLAALVFLQSQDFLLQLGVPPSPSNQAVYWMSGVLTAFCFGLIGMGAAALAGAGAGYFGTPSTPSAEPGDA